MMMSYDSDANEQKASPNLDANDLLLNISK